METDNRELRSTRELAREINSILEALSAGDLPKVVITRNGKFVAVIVTVEAYEQMESDKIPTD